MYTECPECESAFRVTVEVLQQANGSVRCDSCGHEFSALSYLTEEMPAPAGDEPDGEKLAETSRRLLKTLNELAGPDKIQIEDTGLEWRVLDIDNGEVPPADSEPSAERRYDDNTPLPDEFESSSRSDSHYSHPLSNQPEADDEAAERAPQKEADLQLSEPDDWTDLLDEVQDPESDLLQIEEELAAIHNQLSPRDEVADAGPADLDSQFDTQAEEMGLDMSERLKSWQEPEAEIGSEDKIVVETDVAPENETTDWPDPVEVELPIPQNHSLSDVSENIADTELEIADSDLPLDDSPVEFEPAASQDEEESTSEPVDEEELAESEPVLQEDDPVAGEIDFPGSEDDPNETDVVAEDDVENNGEDAESLPVRQPIAEQSKEEMTINMEIDREMMAAAIQDDEFSATLVSAEFPEQASDENAAGIESIIMEGEQVRGLSKEQAFELDAEVAESADEPVNLAGTYTVSRETLRGGRRKNDPLAYKTLAAIALLAIALVVQAIHNSRESLATTKIFSQVVAPVYQFLGHPVTPEWNIKDWQFEVTSGSVNENETALTIVSRIVNKAEQPLPYPLVHVSLVDRWEEVMGSRVMGPDEYLAGNLNSELQVLPGENFTAVVTIAEPSAEATGFKLNVCYRVAPGSVRCAIEDFKN